MNSAGFTPGPAKMGTSSPGGSSAHTCWQCVHWGTARLAQLQVRGCPLLGAAGSNGSNGRAAVPLREAGGAWGAAEGRCGAARRSGGVRGVPRGNCSTWRSFAGASLSYGNEAIKMASQVLLSLSLSLTAQELFPLFHLSVPFREVRAHLGSTQVYHMNVWWAKYQMQQ